MQTLHEKLKLAIAEKTKAIEKAEVEVSALEAHQKSIRRFPLKWPYNVTVRNAKRTVLQVRILHCLFEREKKVAESKRNISPGMTTHQLWKYIYPQSANTSSVTFRGHILDLQEKGLIAKSSEPEFWLSTEKASEKRVRSTF